MSEEPAKPSWGALIGMGAFIVVASIFGWWFMQYGQYGDVRRAVANELVDPGAAQFRNLRPSVSGGVCGEVNGKNRMGAYTGFTLFHYRRPDPHHDIEGGVMFAREVSSYSYGEIERLQNEINRQTNDLIVSLCDD